MISFLIKAPAAFFLLLFLWFYHKTWLFHQRHALLYIFNKKRLRLQRSFCYIFYCFHNKYDVFLNKHKLLYISFYKKRPRWKMCHFFYAFIIKDDFSQKTWFFVHFFIKSASACGGDVFTSFMAFITIYDAFIHKHELLYISFYKKRLRRKLCHFLLWFS